MKIFDPKCPHCGANLNVDMASRRCTCEYCGAHLIIEEDDQDVHFVDDDRNDYESNSGPEVHYANPQPAQTQPRRTWLWILGWIFIFPLPLTILIARNNNLKPWLKALIIVAAWFTYFMIGLANSN